jgi:integrase/recombinase XerD
MFALYSHGIRASDAILMKWSNIVGDRLIYEMRKSEQDGVRLKERSVKILSPALKILNHYRDNIQPDPDDFIFPFIKDDNLSEYDQKQKAKSANAMINLRLKDIQKMAKIPNQISLSLHIARHSFARWAYESKMMTIDQIRIALGHSTEKQTREYLEELSSDSIDDAVDILYTQKAEQEMNI